MLYTESEIINAYRLARRPRSQIKILAQLNAVPEATIREILARNGYEVKAPKRSKRCTWTEDEEREAVTRRLAGQKIAEIAQAMNRTDGAVSQKIQTLINTEQFKAMQSEYEKGVIT